MTALTITTTTFFFTADDDRTTTGNSDRIGESVLQEPWAPIVIMVDFAITADDFVAPVGAPHHTRRKVAGIPATGAQSVRAILPTYNAPIALGSLPP